MKILVRWWWRVLGNRHPHSTQSTDPQEGREKPPAKTGTKTWGKTLIPTRDSDSIGPGCIKILFILQATLIGIQGWKTLQKIPEIILSPLKSSLVTQVMNNLPAMQETQFWSLGQEDPLEKGVATHSSILAWRIPWTEEPGRLLSMELQRVRHTWVTNTLSVMENLTRK